MTVRGSAIDPVGRRVELTDERWGHIVERHPEIDGRDAEVLQAVEAPDERLPGGVENEEWYYTRTDAPSKLAEGRRSLP